MKVWKVKLKQLRENGFGKLRENTNNVLNYPMTSSCQMADEKSESQNQFGG